MTSRPRCRPTAEALARDVAPVSGPVPLEEAIARAIKYNAGQRLRAMEEAVAQGTYDVSTFDMLPKLVASAGYRYRDKDLITRSTDSVTGSLAGASLHLDRPRLHAERPDAVLEPAGFRPELLRRAPERRPRAHRRRAPPQGHLHAGAGCAHRLLARGRQPGAGSSLRSARDRRKKRWPTPARPRPSSCARRWSRCATSASCWRTCACWKPSRKNCRRPASSWRR